MPASAQWFFIWAALVLFWAVIDSKDKHGNGWELIALAKWIIFGFIVPFILVVIVTNI
tara:strand:- start:10 stop:183 length:174 start_codon:yes stop_codon:yes gene_type:complete